MYNLEILILSNLCIYFFRQFELTKSIQKPQMAYIIHRRMKYASNLVTVIQHFEGRKQGKFVDI